MPLSQSTCGNCDLTLSFLSHENKPARLDSLIVLIWMWWWLNTRLGRKSLFHPNWNSSRVPPWKRPSTSHRTAVGFISCPQRCLAAGYRKPPDWSPDKEWWPRLGVGMEEHFSYSINKISTFYNIFFPVEYPAFHWTGVASLKKMLKMATDKMTSSRLQGGNLETNGCRQGLSLPFSTDW